MSLVWTERLSDSPLVESVWLKKTFGNGVHSRIPDSSVNLIIVRDPRQVQCYINGPTTSGRVITYEADSETIGIRLKPELYLANVSTEAILNGQLDLAIVRKNYFKLEGRILPLFDFSNIEPLVEYLWTLGILRRNAYVHDVVSGSKLYADVSTRTVQRHFMQDIGLTPHYLLQAQRAHRAMSLIKQGVPALRVSNDLGYSDQSHMIRSLKNILGHTPTQFMSLPQKY